MKNTVSARSYGLIALLGLVFFPVLPCAQNPALTPSSPAAGVLELLQAEVLDTVSLDRPVIFTSTAGEPAMAQPGVYRVEPTEHDGLRLIPAKGPPDSVLVLQALPSQHPDDIESAVALSVPDGENVLHVVLLLPGGRALDTVGSYSAIHTRGEGPTALSSARLHEAYLRKRENLQQRSNHPGSNPSGQAAQ